jgi:PKD repeat protein
MSDSYSNTYSSSRTSYYGISSIPNCYFDGVDNYLGGSSSTYSNYLGIYNSRIVVPTYYNVDIYGQNTGLNYSIDILAEEIDTYTTSDLRVHLILTESNVSGYNYICRLMVPDENGTSIDFTSGTQQQVSLQFTLDAGYTASECELVVIIQDNNTKEVMQTDKVALDNLQPMAATAGFTCSDTTACEGGTVSFYEESLGIITSYNWTFEGGSPATSTDPNPVITYNTAGFYDVRQIVSDGTNIDTLTITDYIYVKTVPAQANTPTGNADLCQDASSQYTTNSVQYASMYTWVLEPSNAGTISGSDTIGALNLSQSFTGDITIKVRAENECGDGAWSNVFNATVYVNPEIFNLTTFTGGSYCEGDPGAEVFLDGSEAGVDYELFLDDVSTGIIETGTGDTLSFGYQADEGIYTAVGHNTHCNMGMAGSAWVHMIAAPGQAATPTGSTAECNYNDSTVYTTTGASDADSYVWTLSPEEAGVIEGTEEEAVVDWSDDYSGLAYINVAGFNECGDGQMSNDLEVNVFATPTPEISGDQLVCQYYTGIVYSTPDNTGSTYTWEIEGGTIASGAGTHEVAVDWGTPGTGWLRVTEVSEDACENTTEDYVVTIDECTGVEELSSQNVHIYPNPVNDELYIELDGQRSDNFQIRIMDLTGKTVALFNETANNGLMKINIENLQQGLYSIEVSGKDAGRITKRLIKN